MTLRAAVIGVGCMGRNHVRVYRELPETELVAVANSASAMAEKVGTITWYRYVDYQELLAAEKPDLVSIVVPTTNHYQVALEALQAGCHVLVEKPITVIIEQGQELTTWGAS